MIFRIGCQNERHIQVGKRENMIKFTNSKHLIINKQYISGSHEEHLLLYILCY